MIRFWALIVPALLVGASACAPTRPISSAAHQNAAAHVGIPGRCEEPSVPNDQRDGCYFDTAMSLGAVSGPLYWHIVELPDLASAQAARPSNGAVVTAYGRFFLEVVNTQATWGGEGRKLASIGPMSVMQNVPLTARLMQAKSGPGAMTRPHVHSGPEGFFVIDGSICVETPDGKVSAAAGQGIWLPSDLPMALSSPDAGIRRSLVLVVHPSDRPWIDRNLSWKPLGICLR